MGFPGGSDGKASVYNAGYLGSSPGLGRSPGEGNGNPLQYSCLENPMDQRTWWTSLVAQTVKPLSTMQDTPVRALGWEDPLEKEMAIHSSTIA